MEHKKRAEAGSPKKSGQPSAQNESGLSFQEEPTGLGRNPVASEGKRPDPANDSSHAAFTPGSAPQSRPAFAPRRISKTTLLVLVLAILVLFTILFLL